ncbi:MAG TPA: thiamine-phosphate kinase, partial [Candidatus Nitrosotenuis sp.]|nr:thiamine-phosphate kinase [Candidatus Nitrosotenuis sp.]
RLDFVDLVFNGGEEYEIVATVPPKNLAKLKKIAKSQNVNLIEIGYVENGSGVFLQNKTKIIRISDKGWSHFRD